MTSGKKQVCLEVVKVYHSKFSCEKKYLKRVIMNCTVSGETEYRQLGEQEISICRKACAPGGTTVQDLGKTVLQLLYKQGLIYLSVPISPADHISIPPLEVRALTESVLIAYSCVTCHAS